MDDVLPPLSYAPDGLYESDIDALIAEYFTADESSAVSDRVTTNRHVRRLTAPDVPIPFSPPLEQAILPQLEDTKEACRALLAY